MSEKNFMDYVKAFGKGFCVPLRPLNSDRVEAELAEGTEEYSNGENMAKALGYWTRAGIAGYIIGKAIVGRSFDKKFNNDQLAVFNKKTGYWEAKHFRLSPGEVIFKKK